MIDLSSFPGPNSAYVLDLYERYRSDPLSVDEVTRDYFTRLERADQQLVQPAQFPAVTGEVSRPFASIPASEAVRLAMGATSLARTIREYGHLAARLDPLGSAPPGDPGLEPAAHQILAEELTTLAPSVVPSQAAPEARTALDVIERLREIYCGSIGYDFTHVQMAEERTWLIDTIESEECRPHLSRDQSRALLERLTRVEGFEQFLQQTYRGKTRFSIEGLDALIPMLDEILTAAGAQGTGDVLVGMAHRGRLNVLTHVLGRPYAEIVAEFEASKRGLETSMSVRDYQGWTGDVQYHEGGQRVVNGDTGEYRLTVHLAPNPSHLEHVNPVVEGRTRAAQEQCLERGLPRQDVDSALALLVHGDASFTGQGIVAETLNLSQLPGYTTGGTIHIIANNQIGFTTDPSDGRSTLYASDLAKGFEIPVFHVNADDLVACLMVSRLAVAYRYRFHKDVLIDLVGYRRLGHNEGDEPSFTQPQMYAMVAQHPTLRTQVAQRLIADGMVTDEEAAAMATKVRDELERAVHAINDAHSVSDQEYAAQDVKDMVPTEVRETRLRELNAALFTLPEGFEPRASRIIERRREALDVDGPIDWGHAELLALASILADGTPIRLAGQDSQRGTFGQRLAAVHEARTGQRISLFHQLPQVHVNAAIYNSPLSEAAVLGFEYGYSIQRPEVLVLWEAQYGDFINGAQVIVDEFVVSGYAKWAQTSSLVLLLPHGYEGQGPDHSSARIERFLRLCTNNNLVVANCTTAAQYYHLLRRHAAIARAVPIPLVVFTPKSLLRHPKAAAHLSDLARGRFYSLLDDPLPGRDPAEVTRLILCSGKIYVDLDSAPSRPLTPSIAIARIEQLYPVPEDEIRRLLQRYVNVKELVWVQEEPSNMGALPYYLPIVWRLAGQLPLRVVARSARVSPAEGSPEAHRTEQNRIVREALLDAPVLDKAKREVIHAS
ncbi:MAG: 2-oxoglutarate dehydrogenase E1 component [Chloroflexi bacterium]|nr:2-oxoglutarate dehydrogenase E1 component [Chloroflexota bacterium]